MSRQSFLLMLVVMAFFALLMVLMAPGDGVLYPFPDMPLPVTP